MRAYGKICLTTHAPFGALHLSDPAFFLGVAALCMYPNQPTTINTCKNDYVVSTRLCKYQTIHTRYMKMRYAPSIDRRVASNQALAFKYQSHAIKKRH